jgi:hypothetical protein
MIHDKALRQRRPDRPGRRDQPVCLCREQSGELHHSLRVVPGNACPHPCSASGRGPGVPHLAGSDRRFPAARSFEPDYGAHGGYTPEYLGGSAFPPGTDQAGGGPRIIVLMFVAKDDDLAHFRGCPQTVRHLESEGMFVGDWLMEKGKPATWVRVRGLWPSLEQWAFYDGYVQKMEYGNKYAFGHVWCETGDARFRTYPFPMP